MVSLKTKSEKHANDNEKRRQSIREREKTKLNQYQVIKSALLNSSLNNLSKKIVFSDEENDVGAEGKLRKNSNSNKKNKYGKGKPILFGDSDSENEDLQIREKTQFKGKKGFELLNLQSTYGNDERFKIDKRFLDHEKDEDDNQEMSPSNEKAAQLKILGSVLGTPIPVPDKEKKANKRTHEMIRYDASKKEHEIYEVRTQTSTSNASSFKKKSDRKRYKTNKEVIPRPKVSKEKFYEVSNEIKNQFKEKCKGQFSLLQTYASNEAETGKDNEGKEVETEEGGGWDTYFNKEPVKMVKEQHTVKKDIKVNDKGVVAKGIWKESFFFVEDDKRFKEALEFINKKNSDEALEVAKNYDKTRRHLKEILRLHLKKQMRSKDPFRNKVGGLNKKQLANSKFRNSKTTFTKKKSH